MKSKIGSLLLVVAMGGMMLVGSAAAQQGSGAGPGAVDLGHPRVNQVNRREARQHRRIANGVRNDTLTPRQTARLEHREAHLQRVERADIAKHNGHLTKQEQRNLNRRENRISRSIARDKAKNR
jgi:hypothetical protein